MISVSHSVRQPEDSPDTVKTLSRGLRVLSVILETGRPMGVTDIANRVGLHKATVSRMLRALSVEGYVFQDSTSMNYTIGPALGRWLRTSVRDEMLIQRSRPYLTQLRDRSGETAALFIRAGHELICVSQEVSGLAIRREHVLGERLPITHGAVGRVYLAFATPDEAQWLLDQVPLKPMATKTILDKNRYLELLPTIRRNGYAIAESETVEGMSGIAAPLLSLSGDNPLGVISVSGPSFRWTRTDMEELAPTLVDTNETIVEIIGA